MGASEEVLEHYSSYYLSRAIYVACELRIADILFDAGALTLQELAEKSQSHELSLYRLLRFLVSYGIFHEDTNKRYSLNEKGACLARQSANSIAHFIMVDDAARWNAFGCLKECVISGKTAFEISHGSNYYTYLSNHPDASIKFDEHMAQVSYQENKQLPSLLPLKGEELIVDVGGNQGEFLFQILHYFPHTQGILFDLEHVVIEAEDSQFHLDPKRWKAVAGNFLDAVYSGGDVYLLKRVLHNWSDEECLIILKNIKAAMKQESVLYVFEAYVPETTEKHPSKLVDMCMLALFSGKERTLTEFKSLFSQAGLILNKVIHTNVYPSILVIHQQEFNNS